jgi:hypothetical protein
MKNEKKASVLTASQYSADDLTLYNDKELKIKKHNVNKKIFNNESLSFTSDTNLNNFVSYDLNINNIVDIDLNIRTGSIATNELDYGSTTSDFQTLALNTQYDFDCTYAKTSTDIQQHDLILKRKFFFSFRFK